MSRNSFHFPRISPETLSFSLYGHFFIYSVAIPCISSQSAWRSLLNKRIEYAGSWKATGRREGKGTGGRERHWDCCASIVVVAALVVVAVAALWTLCNAWEAQWDDMQHTPIVQSPFCSLFSPSSSSFAYRGNIIYAIFLPLCAASVAALSTPIPTPLTSVCASLFEYVLPP